MPRGMQINCSKIKLIFLISKNDQNFANHRQYRQSNNINYKDMLWKRHHSIYASSAQRPEPQSTQDNQKLRSALVPLISTPASNSAHQSIEQNSQNQKYGRKASKQKINKNLIPGSFFLHRGNNHQIVKSVLESFGYCQNLSKEVCCLIWYQGKDVPKKDFQKREYIPKATNYLPNHFQITNKQKLFENISKYDPSSVGSFIPRTYVVDFKDNVPVVQNNLTQFLVEYFKKSGLSKPPKKTSSLYISNYYAQICIPLARVFKQIGENRRSSSPEHPNRQNLWIVKPAFLNRGQGIEVITTLKQLQNILSEDSQQISIRMYQPQEKNVPSSFVIQEYIMDPLLYQGYKFDMRVWMLLRVSKSKGLEVFLHKKGYVRLACHKYTNNDVKQQQGISTDPDENDKKPTMSKSIENPSPQKPSTNLKSIDANDRYVHLTNNAVQKNCKQYGTLHEGNQLLISDLTQKLNLENLTQTYLYNNFKKIVKVLIQSSKQKLEGRAAIGSFQLMGLDFMVDSKFNVWLIEANCNPCLEESSAILKQLIPEMLKEMFQIVKIHRIMGVKETQYETVAEKEKEKCWEKIM